MRHGHPPYTPTHGHHHGHTSSFAWRPCFYPPPLFFSSQPAVVVVPSLVGVVLVAVAITFFALIILPLIAKILCGLLIAAGIAAGASAAYNHFHP